MKMRTQIPRKPLTLGTCLLLVAVLVFGALRLPAKAVDLSKDATLTVNLGSDEEKEDLAETDMVVDLYLIANAAEVPGYDTYTYSLRSLYSGLLLPDGTEETAAEQNDKWDAARILATEIVVAGSDTPVVTGAALGTTIAALDDTTPLKSGLYLLVARDTSLEDDYFAEVEAEDGTTSIVSLGYSKGYEYHFSTMLISIPTKEAENGSINTANTGDWIYDLTVTLKGEREPRLSEVHIIKTMNNFIGTDPVTVVFQVEATWRSEKIYSNVHAITFTAGGSEELVIYDMPIGAEVTVTEVYSGAGYIITGGTLTQTVTPISIEPITVEFENTYDDEEKSGHGIINHFEADSDGRWLVPTNPDKD